MITEHNYPKIWLLQVSTASGQAWISDRWDLTGIEDQAICFTDQGSAQQYADRLLIRYPSIEVIEIEFPFLLEYDMRSYWQKQRTYRTTESALAGFDSYIKDARGTWAGGLVFRVVDVRTGETIKQARPDSPESADQRPAIY